MRHSARMGHASSSLFAMLRLSTNIDTVGSCDLRSIRQACLRPVRTKF